MAKAKAGTCFENIKPVSPTLCVEQTRDCDSSALITDFSVAPDQVDECKTVAIRSLTVPLQDQAAHFFFYNFVSVDPSSRSAMNAYSRVLPTLYRQDSSFGVLPRIIDAIGLAGISNIKHSPELMVAAGQKYATALRAINASIQDSSKASTDQTLIAVVLLGMFEVFHYLQDNVRFFILTITQTVTCSNPESMRSWANHVNGASAIARIRGTDQLRTEIGRKIFATLRVQIVSLWSKDEQNI